MMKIIVEDGRRYRVCWCDQCKCDHRYFIGYEPDSRVGPTQEIRDRWAKATKGPYGLTENNFIVHDFFRGDPESGLAVAEVDCHAGRREDAEFLAHSWADIQTLLNLLPAAKDETR